ncbi:MAG: NAD kinase [Cryomorphaceae bacterium]|nr:NAD kinase [Cryomorphaceae bacterium]
MKVAVYGRQFTEEFDHSIRELVKVLIDQGHEIIFFKKFLEFLHTRPAVDADFKTFEFHNDLIGCDLLISIGGDGTLLDTVTMVRDSGIPILGVNTGRLGFLSNVSTEDIETALKAVNEGRVVADNRSLIQIYAEGIDLGEFPFALNEVTIHKKDDASMVTVHAYLENKFINTYWADGLIVATPTGSTAYSLSCGGPIVTPDSENIIMTPIAPHNLNVRPLVLPNNKQVRLRADGRSSEYLLTLDSRSFALPGSVDVVLSNAPFKITLLNLEHQHFFQTIRNKMMWGIDRRN